LVNIWVIIFCETMSSSSSQCRVCQKTEKGIAATGARIENRQAIPKRNVVRADVMVAPLDIIVDIIQTFTWDISTTVHA
jgi:hypothetical protein